MIRTVEKLIFLSTRATIVIAVLASWFGAILMLYIGVEHTLEGFWSLAGADVHHHGGELPSREATVVHIIEALDRFLIAVVLCISGTGYGLFIRPGLPPQTLGLPDWLRGQRGQAQTDGGGSHHRDSVRAVLRVALEAFHTESADITLVSLAHFLLLCPCRSCCWRCHCA